MKSTLIAVVLCISAVASPMTASADHQSYCYDGQCLHIDGEQHMIDALRAMDDLFAAPCVRTRGRASVVVQREIGRAIGDVKSTDARLLLIKSQGLVGRFVGTGNPVFLDKAAQLVTQAIAAEQLAYERLQANQRYNSRRVPISHGRVTVTPSRYGYARDYGYNARRTPVYSRGFGYQPNPGYGSGYHPGHHSGFSNPSAGRPAHRSSGFSLRIGR